jgi:protein-tyrosine phosphatase
MLFFNKNKTVLKDLIPENHVDIHSHLLPGIDDGAQTIDDTLFLLDSLKNMGVSKFITTPHIFSGFWDNTKDKIQALELETNSNNNTSFKAAAEYLMDDHFISLFQKGEILTLKDNYVLVEMSYLNPPIQLFDIIFDLQIAGYKPVLAHPERYAFYHNNFDLYQKLKNAGCLFQLNLLSTVGYYGKEVAHAAEKLLKKGLIDFVGSDVHHKKHIDSFDKKILIKDLQPLKEAIANNQFFK